MKIPKDPFLAVSVLNTALRDHYGTLEELCGDAGEDEEKLKERMLSAGFVYRPEIKSFREK